MYRDASLVRTNIHYVYVSVLSQPLEYSNQPPVLQRTDESIGMGSHGGHVNAGKHLVEYVSQYVSMCDPLVLLLPWHGLHL